MKENTKKIILYAKLPENISHSSGSLGGTQRIKAIDLLFSLEVIESSCGIGGWKFRFILLIIAVRS